MGWAHCHTIVPQPLKATSGEPPCLPSKHTHGTKTSPPLAEDFNLESSCNMSPFHPTLMDTLINHAFPALAPHEVELCSTLK